MDAAARLSRLRNSHRTLFCERCSRRIAWWTAEHAHSTGSGWQWQGRRTPLRYRPAPDAARGVFPDVVDVECFSCGWKRTYPFDDLFMRVKVRK